MSNPFIVAGDAAENCGAFTGWDGRGSLDRETLVNCRFAAGLPVSANPPSKSDVNYLGKAVRDLANLGYVVRSAKTPKHTKNDAGVKSRPFRKRFVVAVADAAVANIGEAVGTVVMIATLKDDNSEVILEGNPDLCARVQSEYEAAMGAESFTAGEVTQWLRSVLMNHFGAARYAIGYYIPNGMTEKASHFMKQIDDSGWGNIAYPLTPIATTEAMQANLAKGFTKEIDALAYEFGVAQTKAREAKKLEISPKVAGRMLSQLAEIDKRADGYRVLCGDEVLQAAVAKLAKLHRELTTITSDASQRFALLELDVSTVEPPVVEAVSPAERKANEVVEAKHATENFDPQGEIQASIDSRRDEFTLRYKAARTRSGLAPNSFDLLVRGELERVGVDEPTPADWATAAESLTA